MKTLGTLPNFLWIFFCLLLIVEGFYSKGLANEKIRYRYAFYILSQPFGCTKYHRLDNVQNDELQEQKELINDFHSDDFCDSDSGCDPDCDSGSGSVSTGNAKSTKNYWTDEKME